MTKDIDVVITYDSLWGHGFLSIRFARFITHCFDLKVEREFKNNGVFEIHVNGRSVYLKKGEVDTGQNPLFLVDILKAYAPLVRTPESGLLPDDNEDPEHREWMQSFCSGE